MKFPHLEKIVNLMKYLKYKHQSICPCRGGSNLILVTGMENQILILITPAAINYFHQILKNCHFSVRKKSFLTHMDLYDPYMVPYTIL